MIDSIIEQAAKSDLPSTRPCRRCSPRRRRSAPVSDMSTVTDPGSRRGPAPRPPKGKSGTPSRTVDPMRRQQAVAAWVLALPFMVLFLVFTAGPVLASLGMSFTDMRPTDIRSPFGRGVRRARQLHPADRGPAVPQGHPEHPALPAARRPADDGRGPRGRGRAEPDHPAQGLLPGRLLPAGRHQHRRGLGRVEVPAPRPRRPGQHGARPGRHRRAGLARLHHARRCRRWW